ncbi:MAG TPA: F0F1 ATP synthase subunit B [bacterium]|nr:F0F1 ATP synthase subunit B [bacterium]
MDLITKLGIDGRLLLAQLLNFLILIMVLNYFLYRPILQILKNREQQVKKSITDSEKIEHELLKIAKDREQTILKAKKEARQIISDSKATAEVEKQEIVSTAKAEAEKIIAKAKLENIQMSKDIKQNIIDELSEIIISVTEQLLSKKITGKDDQKMIKEAIKSML